MPRRACLLLLPLLLACALAAPLAPPPALSTAPPSLTLVSSFPLSGAVPAQDLVRAIQLRLDQAGSRACAGRFALRYDSWDDASAAASDWDPAVETANAQKAAADPGIIAYIGPLNAGAAQLSIPILDQAGPLLMLGLADGYSGLTKSLGALPGEPEVYYPAGLRNYVRLNMSDDVQGGVAALFAQGQLQARTVYLLDDGQPYGLGLAGAFQAAAGPLGLSVLGRATIDPNAPDYQTLMGRISLSNAGRPPDAIYAALRSDDNAAQVLKDKVSLMGDNTRVKFLGPDGLAVQAFIDGAGPRVAEGVYASQPGLDFADLPPAAQQFRRDYEAQYGGQMTDVYAAAAYDAASVTLSAIETVCAAGGSPADRRAIRDAVFNTHNFQGALGAWSFDPNGDTSLTGTRFFQVQAGHFTPIASKP